MKKIFNKYLIIIAIILAVYNVLVFVIPFPQKDSGAFWLNWAFGLIAIISQPLIAWYALRNSNSLKSKVYGWPIIKTGYIYLIVQLTITIILFIIRCFIFVEYWIVIVLETIILSLAAIGIVSQQTYKEEIIKMEQQAPLTTKFIVDLRVETQNLVDRVNDKKIMNALVKLSEEVKYSDPVSSEELEATEDEINRRFMEIKDDILNGKFDSILINVDSLITLIRERNERIKFSKK